MVNKILIVDDEPNNLDILHNCLSEAGFKVLVAESGNIALKQVNYVKPDLILLDVKMPGLDGFETCRRLKHTEATQDTPIIFVSVDDDPVDKIKGFETGAVDYITKPFLAAEVLARVNKHLTIHNLQKQLEAKNAQLQEHIDHLACLDRLRQAISETHQMGQMINNAMQVTLSVFQCDRVWLLYPCDPNAPSWRVPIEVTRSEYPGIYSLNQELPNEPQTVDLIKKVLSAKGPMAFGSRYEHQLPPAIVQQFSIQSQLCLAIYPKIGQPWLFGLHQCAYAREWNANEFKLFRDFGHQISQSLALCLSFEELQQSEQRFRGYFESALVGFAMLSVERRWIYVNNCLCDLLGYTPAELTQLSWEELSDPEDLATEAAQFEQLLAGEIDSYTMDKRFIHYNGSRIYVFLSVTARYQKQGSIEHIVATFQDLTERKQAEKALFQREEQFRKLFEEGPIGMVIATIDLHLVKANNAFCQMLGYTEAELLQLTVTDITYPKDMIENQKLLQKALTDDKPYQQEKRYIRKNGKLIWGHLTVSFFYNDAGQISHLLGKIEDITERKQAEKALQESHQRFTAVTNSLDALVYVNDLETYELLFLNQYGRNLLGSDVIGQPCWKVLRSRQTGPCSFCTNDQLLDQQGNPTGTHSWEFQNTITGQWYLCRDQAIQWPDGRLVRMEVATDITERKRGELALKQAKEEADSANRLKSEFLANMSHELRTPLNAVITFCELLLDNIPGPLNPEQQKAVEQIQKSGKHLLSLINDILDLSKIEAGQLELKIEPIQVNNLCQDSLQFVKLTALKKRIKLLKVEDGYVTTIQGDERGLKQILVNLLNNAVKFTPNGGQIRLEITGDELTGVVQFSVIDTGIGIPEQEIEQLFQPFVQLESQLSRQQEGTGLGLALVYRLTELHGGSIHVESEIGKGSRFTVSLPWQVDDNSLAIHVVEESPPELPTIGHQGARILLAEDQESNIFSIQTGLQARGYQLVIARNGEQALELIQKQKPALILMDIQMPKMSGLDAIQQIRRDTDLAQIPIIALTALAMPGDRDKCLQAGANSYFSKPIQIKRLIEEIEKLLSNNPTQE